MAGDGRGKDARVRGGRSRRALAFACVGLLVAVAVGVLLVARPWDGGGSIERDDYETVEEYLDAVARSLVPEAEVAEDWVDDGEHACKYKAGWLSITFDEDVKMRQAKKVVKSYGGTWVSGTFMSGVNPGFNYATAYFAGLHDATFAELEEFAEELCKEDGVRGASPMESNTSTCSANDPEVELQMYLETSGFLDAWESQTCDGTVKVAILDVGFQCTHEDLTANISYYVDVNDPDTDVMDNVDSAGHGTAVAGVVSAVANNSLGIAGASYNADISLFRVMNEDDDAGGDVSNANVIAALWILLAASMAGEGPDALNMSFAGSDWPEHDISNVQALLDVITEYGVVCVAAAGNYEGGSGDSLYASKYPACLDNVLSVGSVDASCEVSGFSQQNSSVDLCALGEGVYTTENEGAGNGAYGFMQGTSFAAPQVAAVAALLKACDSKLGANDISDIITSTATDLGAQGRDDIYGFGLLNAAAALSYVADEESGSGSDGGSSGGTGGTGGSATSPGTGGSVAGLFAGSAAVASGADGACGVPEGADDG